jgi:hypothetical protein
MTSIADSGNWNFYVTAGLQAIYDLSNCRGMIPDPRPIRRQQHSDSYFPASQILLVAEILICGNERVEIFGFC